tara:strand:+ start:292 stop:510 length:219 start_codon:yes stop_codon:yes gene_type:complete
VDAELVEFIGISLKVIPMMTIREPLTQDGADSASGSVRGWDGKQGSWTILGDVLNKTTGRGRSGRRGRAVGG